MGGYSSGGDASPGRSLSPSKEGGWNIYGWVAVVAFPYVAGEEVGSMLQHQ